MRELGIDFEIVLKDFDESYPEGLKGDEIPLESRILAVASDYDAIISERPYHPIGLSPKEAVEEIKAGSGIKYDPVVVEVFLDLIRERLWQESKAA